MTTQKKPAKKKQPSPAKPQAKRKKAAPKKEKRNERQLREFNEWHENVKAGAPEFPYNQDIADAICFEVATSTRRVKHILESIDVFPNERTFFKWLFNYPEFAQKYAEAKKHQQDLMVDYQDDVIARYENMTYTDKEGNQRIDAPAVGFAKLKCDNIKWEASKLNPKKYGKDLEDTEIQIKKLRSEIIDLTKDKNPHDKSY